MTTRIGAVVYKDTPDARQRFAELGLDTDTEDTFYITLNGTDMNGMHVVPRFVQVDNFENIAPVNITINGIANSVAPYTRTTFEIATYTPEIGVYAYEGTVKIYISEARLGIGDGTNELAKDNAFNMGTYLPRDGGAAMLADFDAGGFLIRNAKDPVALGDVVTRRYFEKRVGDYVVPDLPTDGSDCTAAINKALQHDKPWSRDLNRRVVMPAGFWRVDGPIYVRKGQTFCGVGAATKLDFSKNKTNTGANVVIEMGYGLINGVETEDAGGDPPLVCDFHSDGGADGSQPIIRARVAGYFIRDLFCTNAGAGIYLGGGDGFCENVIVDQTLIGFQIAGQNIQVTGFETYIANYAFLIHGNARSVNISNGTCCYTMYNSVYFNDSEAKMRGILFNNVAFVTNAAYAPFNGHVRSRGNDVDCKFTACHFSNWPGYCITQDSGINIRLHFVGCTFDGRVVTDFYGQNTTSKLLTTGTLGTFLFDGCIFANMYGELLNMAIVSSVVRFNGGQIINCPTPRVIDTTGGRPDISFKDVKGVGVPGATGDYQTFILPYWGGCTAWRVRVEGNTLVQGSGYYSRITKADVFISHAYDGSNQLTYADAVAVDKTPTRVIPADIAINACFGTAPAGAATIAGYSASGNICVFANVPAANAGTFRWDADNS